MEQILDALVDELAKRVVKKLGEDNEKMREFFKIKIKVEDVIGLDELIEDRLDTIKGECVSAAEDAAKEMIDNLEVEVEASISGR